MMPAPPDRSSVLPAIENSGGRGRDPAAPTGHQVIRAPRTMFLERETFAGGIACDASIERETSEIRQDFRQNCPTERNVPVVIRPAN
jgi:hypothetical protein